jgi:DNA polymerase-3 subunit epsilon
MRIGRWVTENVPFMQGQRRASSPRLSESRLIVLDVDVTGVNLRRDYATGIAILEVKEGTFSLSDLRYCPLNNELDSDLGTRYRAMLDFIGSAPIFAYNARFVKHMIKHAASLYKLPVPLGLWIDIRGAVHSSVGREPSEIESVARWQERMNIARPADHSAVADVFATAQMLQTLIAYCDEMGIATVDDLQRAQKAYAWLKG